MIPYHKKNSILITFLSFGVAYVQAAENQSVELRYNAYVDPDQLFITIVYKNNEETSYQIPKKNVSCINPHIGNCIKINPEGFVEKHKDTEEGKYLQMYLPNIFSENNFVRLSKLLETYSQGKDNFLDTSNLSKMIKYTNMYFLYFFLEQDTRLLNYKYALLYGELHQMHSDFFGRDLVRQIKGEWNDEPRYLTLSYYKNNDD